MNVLFHTTAAIGISVMLINPQKVEHSGKKYLPFLAFILGIISHGMLDYMPHCYPLNSKIDAVVSLILMIMFTCFSNKRYRLIVAASFIGSVFPDIIDLSPAILNKLLALNIPIFNKMFPWHWRLYSGSIYNDHCTSSNIYHTILVVLIVFLLVLKRKRVQTILSRN